MASTSKPDIVLVHGAWHQPAHYAPFAQRLRDAGFEVHVPYLPTCQPAVQSQASMYDDAKVVRDQVVALVEKDKDVLMLLHSYGGAVGAEAIKGLSKAERHNQQGGVTQLIYMCAFILQCDESVGGASLPRPDPDPVAMDETSGTTYISGDPHQMFYGDVETSTAKDMVTLLVHQAARALGDPVHHEPWRIIATTYLKCEMDGAIFPDWQQRQIEAVQSAGGNIKVESYKSSHSPFLSMPEEMLQAIERSCT